MTKAAEEPSNRREQLRHAIRHASHLLPAQGPIGVFIHHNTLHAFQHLPFEDAVVQASRLYGTEPYMCEEDYRTALGRGRILLQDIDAVLAEESDFLVCPWLTRRELRRLMLHPGPRHLDPRTIRWEIEEGDLIASRPLRDLFHGCLQRVQPSKPAALSRESREIRRKLLNLAGEDIDAWVHPTLIRLCGAYLDQGLAYWPMPEREGGFYHAVRSLLGQSHALMPEHLQGLSDAFRRQAEEGMDSEQAVLEALDRLQTRSDEIESVVTGELLAMPGWAGMFHRLEQDPCLAPHEMLPCRLMDFLAVRLTLTVRAAANLAGDAEVLAAVLSQPAPAATAAEDSANRLFRAAELLEFFRIARVDAPTLHRMTDAEVHAVQRELEQFDSVERRRIWHLAYERRHERMILGPLDVYRRTYPPSPPDRRPDAQVFFCLDEREESVRRHLEEIAPSYETLSAAGFYGVAVDYAGIDDAGGVSLCPVVVKPQHAVREKPAKGHHHLYRQRKALRTMWARFVHNAAVSSRTLVRGALSTSVLGVFSMFPLVAHVLSPRQYGNLSRALNRWLLPEPRTELTLMRTDRQGHDVAENLMLGFTVEEKAERVASVLAPAGLYTRFAPIVVVLGHGSTSLNNPHESAHDCGACGGRRGGPNGRLFAAMANHTSVRQLLRARGIHIPDDTWFVGGYHDTCSDEIEYYDLEQLPEHLREAFRNIRANLDRARALDAHERARRFEAAPFGLTPEKALWHVQERSEHLAEPRPEYGHCTNAVCIVGRREVTRGLFFDRRAFLVSYDPLLDSDGENLARLLAAAVPVCAGISLEYYFSYVDNEGYGCGSKLPHNITGLIGVMNGGGSDLRTGLPWQMVEIHEPVRILFNIEAKKEVLERVIRANPLIAELVDNRWVRMSTMDPEDGAIHIYRNGRFELNRPWPAALPQARTSVEWYTGKRDHLPIARIDGNLPGGVKVA